MNTDAAANAPGEAPDDREPPPQHAATRRARPGGIKAALRRIRQALREFLAIPLLLVLGFTALALVLPVVETLPVASVQDVRQFIAARILGDAAAVASLLSTVAGSLITVTSITLSILLLAVQQSAAALTAQVFDQYLRRRFNQFAFGYFVGVAIYSLVTLALISEHLNPVLAATLALLFTAIALVLLIVLTYSAIDQIRGEQIIGAIHDHALPAREMQVARLLRRTRRRPLLDPLRAQEVPAAAGGYLVDIDLDAVSALTRDCRGQIEVDVLIPIGAFRSTGDPIAVVRGSDPDEVTHIAATVGPHLVQSRERDIDSDPRLAVEQLENIGWTSGSTSKQNPAPARAAIHALRDLLAHWTRAADGDDRPDTVVVVPDDLVPVTIGAIESLGIVASESMQHQLLADILEGLALLLPRLDSENRRLVEGCVRRLLTGAGDHVLSRRLDNAFLAIGAALDATGSPSAAGEIRAAVSAMRSSIGHLASRSTRVRDQ